MFLQFSLKYFFHKDVFISGTTYTSQNFCTRLTSARFLYGLYVQISQQLSFNSKETSVPYFFLTNKGSFGNFASDIKRI